MRILWDFLLIISIGVWILGLSAQGYLPPQYSALFLISLVFFIAMIKVGGSLGRLIRWIFKISLPIVSLLIFVTVYGQGNLTQMRDVLMALLGLFIVLLGFYVMVSGLFIKNRKR